MCLAELFRGFSELGGSMAVVLFILKYSFSGFAVYVEGYLMINLLGINRGALYIIQMQNETMGISLV